MSSTILYENETPIYQDYLMENGVWKLRHFHKDGHVEINAKYPEYLLQYQGKKERRKFSRLIYDDIAQVICEVLLFYLHLTKEGDVFCVAMHERHIKLLSVVLK